MSSSHRPILPVPPAAMLPPPVPESNQGSSSQSSSSSRKRKHSITDDNASEVSEAARSQTRVGRSVSSFSASVKEKVINVDNGEVCWHCSANPTDICHVIGQKDKRFSDLVTHGLICFTQLSHIDNAIPLCPTCHSNFDDALNPGFIFIPVDLEYFIEFERADQARRRSIMSHSPSIIPARVPPTAESYRQHMLRTGAITDDDTGGGTGGGGGGLYLRYTLRKYFSPLVEQGFVPGLGPHQEAVPWHGSPMAALWRAFRVLGDPLMVRGVPTETREMLRELVDLYAWDPSGGGDVGNIQQDGVEIVELSHSSLSTPPPPPPRLDDADERAEHEHEHESRQELPPTQTQTQIHPIIATERTAIATYPSISTASTSSPAHNNDIQRPPTAQPELTQTPRSPSPSQKKPSGYSHSRWKWGPGATSWDAMCFYTAISATDENRSPKRQKRNSLEVPTTHHISTRMVSNVTPTLALQRSSNFQRFNQNFDRRQSHFKMPIRNNPLPSSMASECKKYGKTLASFIDPRQAFGSDKVIPPSVLANAKGLAIITVLKAGFLGSGRYGNGIVVVRLADGAWAAPSAIVLGGAGFVGQIGFELTDFVFVLNDAAAVRAFSQDSLTLGGNVSLAAGPIGRNAEAASLKGVASVFSYSKTKGLYTGVSLEGSAIVERRDANEKLYGQRYTAAQLLTGGVRPPPAASSLMNVLNSRVFSGISGADDSMYNDIPQYDNQYHDVVWEGRRGCGYGEEQPRNTGGDFDSPKRASTCANNVYKPAFTSKTIGLKENQAVALFTFDADQPGDLGFKKGEIITVTKKTGKAEDWWTGMIGTRVGIFPSNYVEMKKN